MTANDVSRPLETSRAGLLPWPAVDNPSPTPPAQDRGRAWPALLALVVAFLALMFLYEAARDFVAPGVGAAAPHRHADQVISAERSLGLLVEPDVQRAVHRAPGGQWATTWFYTIAYTAGYAGFLLWVFFFRRSRLRFLFTWYWVTNFVAVVGYWVYPLAPPRFVDELGMADTTKEALELGGSLSWFQPFRNLYAAMPSMHVGQTVLYAIAITLLVRSRWRWLAWLWPAVMLTTVMATANHYWLDGVGGAVCVLAALGLTRLVLREGVRGRVTPAPRAAGVQLLAEE